MTNIPPNERYAWARETEISEPPEFDAIGVRQVSTEGEKTSHPVITSSRSAKRLTYHNRPRTHWSKGWLWFAIMAGAIWLFADGGHFPWWMMWFAWPVIGFVRGAGWRGGLALILLGGVLFARMNWEMDGPLLLGGLLVAVGVYLSLSTLISVLRLQTAS